MSSFRHPEFEDACSVKRGDARLPAAFAAFASAYEREFLTPPLAVGLELLQTGRGPQLWVRVWVERDVLFRDLPRVGNWYVDFMTRREQGVPRMFAETTEPADLAPRVRHGGIDAADLALLPQRVNVWDFEPAAVQAVHDAVDDDDRQRWAESLGLGDELWCVTSMDGAPPVVFVQSDAHAHRLRMTGTLLAWRASYFALARRNDEFGCLSPESCDVRVDSRETFETRYGSSWYAYWH